MEKEMESFVRKVAAEADDISKKPKDWRAVQERQMQFVWKVKIVTETNVTINYNSIIIRKNNQTRYWK